MIIQISLSFIHKLAIYLKHIIFFTKNLTA